MWEHHRDEIRLLLTDLLMPDGLSGRELARRLLQENPRLKVIYTSGYSPEIASGGFPLRESDNFLAKPYQTARLEQAVRANLDAG